MPMYTYNCDKCGEEVEILKGMNDDAPEFHSCGGRLIRDFAKVGVIADQGKSDPKSPMYWKRGKTNGQITDVLTNKSKPY